MSGGATRTTSTDSSGKQYVTYTKVTPASKTSSGTAAQKTYSQPFISESSKVATPFQAVTKQEVQVSSLRGPEPAGFSLAQAGQNLLQNLSGITISTTPTIQHANISMNETKEVSSLTGPTPAGFALTQKTVGIDSIQNMQRANKGNFTFQPGETKQVSSLTGFQPAGYALTPHTTEQRIEALRQSEQLKLQQRATDIFGNANQKVAGVIEIKKEEFKSSGAVIGPLIQKDAKQTTSLLGITKTGKDKGYTLPLIERVPGAMANIWGFFEKPISSTFNVFGIEREQITEKEMHKDNNIAVIKSNGNIVGTKTVSSAEAEYLLANEQAKSAATIISKEVTDRNAAQAKEDLNNRAIYRQNLLDKYKNYYQEKVNNGEISADKANNELIKIAEHENIGLKEDANKISDKYTNISKEEFKNIITPRLEKLENIAKTNAEKKSLELSKKIAIKSLPQTFVTGVVGGAGIAGISVLAGPFAPVVTGAVIGGGVIGIYAGREQIAKSFKDMPLETSLQIATFIAGGVVGGAAVTHIKNIGMKNTFINAAEDTPLNYRGISVVDAGKKIQIVTIEGTKNILGKTYYVKTTMPVLLTKQGGIIIKGGMTTSYYIEGGKLFAKVFTPQGRVMEAFNAQARLATNQGGFQVFQDIQGKVQLGKFEMQPYGQVKVNLPKTGKEWTAISKALKPMKGPEISMQPVGGIYTSKDYPILTKTGPGGYKEFTPGKLFDIKGVRIEKLRFYESGRITAIGWKDPFAGQILSLNVKFPQRGITVTETAGAAHIKSVSAQNVIKQQIARGGYDAANNWLNRMLESPKTQITTVAKPEIAIKSIFAAESLSSAAISQMYPQVSQSTAAVTNALIGTGLITQQISKQQAKIIQAQQSKIGYNQLAKTQESLFISPITMQIQEQLQTQKVSQAQAQQQKVVVTELNIQPSPVILPITTGVTPPPLITTFITGFIPSPFELAGGRRKGQKAKGGKVQQKKYQASVGSAITGWGVSAKDAAKYKGALTGLGLRPMIIGNNNINKKQSNKQVKKVYKGKSVINNILKYI